MRLLTWKFEAGELNKGQIITGFNDGNMELQADRETWVPHASCLLGHGTIRGTFTGRTYLRLSAPAFAAQHMWTVLDKI